ncbi:hypothetical protein OAS39_13395, partial [Pirellulales bacterium]|nr:hypothetical protein [Pirellulales bacterium]
CGLHLAATWGQQREFQSTPPYALIALPHPATTLLQLKKRLNGVFRIRCLGAGHSTKKDAVSPCSPNAPAQIVR